LGVFFGGCMACLLCLFLLFPFRMRNCNCCLQISVGRFLPWGVCGKQIHCCCIFITDIICVEKGKDVCVVKNLKLLDLHTRQLTCSASPV
jgi:hypothetical protein